MHECSWCGDRVPVVLRVTVWKTIPESDVQVRVIHHLCPNDWRLWVVAPFTAWSPWRYGSMPV